MVNARPDHAGRKILLALHSLAGFTGSEIHVLELASYFTAQGSDVSCFAFEFRPPMSSEMEQLGVRLLPPARLSRAGEAFDLVWSHHETAFLWLHAMRGIAARRHVHGLLSSVQKIERLPLIPHDLARGGLRVVANSIETQAAAARISGRSDIRIMPNFVPEAYFASPRGALPDRPAKIAVVSNHVPVEVLAMRGLLQANGMDVMIFGRGHTYARIDETILLAFDLVITIGKTVQYCLAQGIPVFVYDRFGGPGFMAPSELDTHAAFNFSGRSDPRNRSAEALAGEVVANYREAAANAEILRTDHARRFAIGHCVAEAIGDLGGPCQPALTGGERRRTIINHLAHRPQPLFRALAPQWFGRATAIYDRLRGASGS